MRHPLVRLFVASATASLVFASSAFAATVTDKAALTRHGRVAVGEPISAILNFHTRFGSISSVCYRVRFEDDLLDPGETVDFGYHVNIGATGYANFTTSPISEPIPTCLVAGFHDQFIARYLDGKEKLIVSTRDGSMRIASFVFTIEGVPQ